MGVPTDGLLTLLEGYGEEALKALLLEAELKLGGMQLEGFEPYEKQREFYRMGREKAERLLMAGNQLGKTVGVGAEVAWHLTGRYPEWWEGKVMLKGNTWWAAGESGETTRDNVQRVLVGPPALEEMWGTGMLPRDSIVEVRRASGTPNALDSVVVRHGGGGDIGADYSFLSFKAYKQGVESWMGPTLDGVWFDEEPPWPIYQEGRTRTQARGVFTVMTFTPLAGMSDVVMMFYPNPTTEQRGLVRMEIYDAPHYTPEQREAVIAGYQEHEREARSRGIPTLGSGAVFPIAEKEITYEPFAIPGYYRRIAGIDFGAAHPTAVSWMAIDPDSGRKFVYDVYKRAGVSGAENVVTHAAAILARGKDIPVAWPKDGLNETAAGAALAEQYRAQGVRMLETHAQFERVAGEPERALVSVEAGIQGMLRDFQTGKLKVKRGLEDWFSEFRGYHRKNGQIVKMHDDVMDSTRYDWMMSRFARSSVSSDSVPLRRRFNWRAG